MAQYESVEQLVENSTTRRTVVKTGAKLAYIAPVVAASFKLSSTGVAAVSGLDPRCDGTTCGNFKTCNDTEGCICFSTSDGTGYCGIPRLCSEVDACVVDADCPSGQVCAYDTCCTGDKKNSCVIPCAPGLTKTANAGLTQAG